METSDLLRRIAGVFERLGLPYLVTGSTATIFYGEPRFTADIDVVVQLPPDRIQELVKALEGGDLYFDEESIRRAVTRKSQFNIIHPASGLKVDVIVPELGPFDRSRFARGRRVRPDAAFEVTFASPEDVILKKLAYYREGGSEKHLRDVTGVLKISGEELDREYLERWVRELDLAEVWSIVLDRLG
ncbi:MAG: nucleotidyl transferase AbiEii/AbiGii toxin family protein [Chloroflexota bacterium]